MKTSWKACQFYTLQWLLHATLKTLMITMKIKIICTEYYIFGNDKSSPDLFNTNNKTFQTEQWKFDN